MNIIPSIMFLVLLGLCIPLVSTSLPSTTTRSHTTVRTTMTTHGTIPTKPPGCVVNGIHYNPMETISEGKAGNWCYGEICGDLGEIIAWDNFNCGTTTTPPIPTTPTPPTTTIGFIPKCVHGSSIYLPGQEITTWNDGSMCYTMMCGENRVIHTVAHCYCFMFSDTYCRIDNVCYRDGASNPYRQCQMCHTATSTSRWSPSPMIPSTMGLPMSCQQVCYIYSRSARKLDFVCKFARWLSGYETHIYDNICLAKDPASIGMLMCDATGTLYSRISALCSKLQQPGGILSAKADPIVQCG